MKSLFVIHIRNCQKYVCHDFCNSITHLNYIYSSVSDFCDKSFSPAYYLLNCFIRKYSFFTQIDFSKTDRINFQHLSYRDPSFIYSHSASSSNFQHPLLLFSVDHIKMKPLSLFQLQHQQNPLNVASLFTISVSDFLLKSAFYTLMNYSRSVDADGLLCCAYQSTSARRDGQSTVNIEIRQRDFFRLERYLALKRGNV